MPNTVQLIIITTIITSSSHHHRNHHNHHHMQALNIVQKAPLAPMDLQALRWLQDILCYLHWMNNERTISNIAIKTKAQCPQCQNQIFQSKSKVLEYFHLGTHHPLVKSGPLCSSDSPSPHLAEPFLLAVKVKVVSSPFGRPHLPMVKISHAHCNTLSAHLNLQTQAATFKS